MNGRYDTFNTRNAKMNRVYRTAKGTDLPILSLRGRDYLEVKYRLVWFREEHPDWSIETEMVNLTDTSAFVRASIKDDQGRVIATSHKFENKQGFPDFIEKAETGAIGRALALIGYGTQFCADELDEGERIVDSPVDYARVAAARMQEEMRASEDVTENADVASAGTPTVASDMVPSESTDVGPAVPMGVAPESQGQLIRDGRLDAGDYRINFGKKYKGRRLRDIPRNEIESYVEWLESNAEKRGVPLSEEARILKMAVGRYLLETTTTH